MTPRSVFRSALPVVLLGAAFLAACGDDDTGSGDSATTVAATSATTAAPATTAAATTVAAVTVPANMDPLDGTAWVLDHASSELGVEGGDSVVVSVAFNEGNVSGSSGCNTFGGTYTVEGETVTIGSLISTQIACEDPQGAVETVVLERIGQVQGFSLTATDLILTDTNGEFLLRFLPAPTNVDGNWIATGYLKADGTAFTSIIVDTEVTASFQADGTVAGSSGCNTYSGPFTVPLDNTISIGPVAGTRIACADPAGVMEQEAEYIAALESATSFANDGATLTLFNDQGQMAVTFNTFSAG